MTGPLQRSAGLRAGEGVGEEGRGWEGSRAGVGPSEGGDSLNCHVRERVINDLV